MEHFAASSLDLPTILSLFPMIKLPNVGASKDLANVKESESGGPSPRGSLTPSSSETLEGKESSSYLQKPTSECSLVEEAVVPMKMLYKYYILLDSLSYLYTENLSRS
jgi:hypothetical protein